MKIIEEFKTFAIKGNLVDMAVGIVIGAAFTSVVQSLVADIFTPVIGFISGGMDFTDIFTVLGDGEFATLEAAKEAGVPTINWGLFLNAVISFLIVAWIMFGVIKAMNTLKRKEEEKPAAPEAPSKQEVLLTEIRDALVAQQK
jgi:large conductance mechanosensitive channel